MNDDNLNKAIDELKKSPANPQPPKETIDKTIERLNLLEQERKRTAAGFGWFSLLKLAAAAVILLAAGVFAGRLSRPAKIDTVQLAAIEKTLKGTLESQIQQSLEKKFEQELTDFAQQNNEQMSELASSIGDTQQWQQLVIAAVLEEMELNRQYENEELTNALYDFAEQTQQKLQQTNLLLAKLVGSNGVQKSLDNKKDNLQ